MNERATAIASRAAAIRERIDAAARSAGGGPVGLVAVSKHHPVDTIEDALAAGLTDLGENYAQELDGKRTAIVDPRVRWHMIGPVQSNKARRVVGCSLVHTVDRPSLVAALDKHAHAAGAVQHVLVQVNVAGEVGKSGVSPDGLPALLDAFSSCDALQCDGLMLIPELGPPEAVTQQFRALRRLRDAEAAHARPRVDLHTLSMGMSDDFELAIAEGATLVRIGTAIFGARSP